MHDDPKALLVEGALPAYHAFIDSIRNPIAGKNQDLRLAKEAASALYHLREHLAWARVKPYPADIEACTDYHLLGDVVNVLKHGGPRREGAVALATDIYELVVLTEYEDGQGPYQDAIKQVEVKLKDGSVRNVEDVLRNVLNMWIAHYQARGLLTDMRPALPVAHEIPSRVSASSAAQLDYRAVRGVRFEVSFRLQKYNYTTGQIDAVDMTGCQYEFSIRRPVEVALAMTDEHTGEVAEKTFLLSSDEEACYESLKTDQERKAYIDSLLPKYARLAQQSRPS
jgi:hypothetical protein